MRTLSFLGTSVAVLASPAAAGDHSTTYHSEPSTADFAAAKAQSDEIMSLIEAGKFEAAIARIQDNSPLLKQRQQDMDLVVSQAKTGVQLYGPIAKCILSSHTYTSQLRISFNYICQHEQLLLRWTLRADSLPRGWSVTNVSFTDTF